jgi:hypothetical protein
VHEVVNKSESYVRGRVHVNGMENFWSLLTRGLNGTYVAVEPFHLSRYIDEQIFRYNNRATKDNPLNDSDRFDLAVRQIVGKRLTYAELTGKTDDSRENGHGNGNGNGNQSRKDQLAKFLNENGLATRSTINDKSGIPKGTIANLLNKGGFVRRLWQVAGRHKFCDAGDHALTGWPMTKLKA